MKISIFIQELLNIPLTTSEQLRNLLDSYIQISINKEYWYHLESKTYHPSPSFLKQDLLEVVVLENKTNETDQTELQILENKIKELQQLYEMKKGEEKKTKWLAEHKPVLQFTLSFPKETNKIPSSSPDYQIYDLLEYIFPLLKEKLTLQYKEKKIQDLRIKEEKRYDHGEEKTEVEIKEAKNKLLFKWQDFKKEVENMNLKVCDILPISEDYYGEEIELEFPEYEIKPLGKYYYPPQPYLPDFYYKFIPNFTECSFQFFVYPDSDFCKQLLS